MGDKNHSNLMEIRDVVVEFGSGASRKRVVNHVSFSIRQGECLGLVGESGSGKSTIANSILRLLPEVQGKILFKGNNVLTLQGNGLRSFYKDVQVVFQNPDESMSSRIKIGKYITEVYETFKSSDKKILKAKAIELLNSMGLNPDYAERYPSALSGGEKQRVAIARAISILPALLICDEPTSALDVSVQAAIVELLIDLQQKNGLTYLFISHDLPLVSYICQRVIIMYRGEFVEILKCDKLLQRGSHPYTKKLLSAAFSRENNVTLFPEQNCTLQADKSQNGCIFCQECPYRTEKCFNEKPAMVQIEEDHYLACFNY